MKRPGVAILAAGLAILYDVSSAQQPAVRGLDIHYVPTPMEVVDAMLSLANVASSDVVYDLGSGDGRIPIEAARKFGARAVGVELDPALVRRARENARTAGVSDKVTFVQQDLFKTDLSEASVVTLFLSPSVNLRLQSKLQRELKPAARVVSNRFPIGDWLPNRTAKAGTTPIMLWLVQ